MRKTIDGELVIEITFSEFKKLPGSAGIYLHNHYTGKIKYYKRVKEKQ